MEKLIVTYMNELIDFRQVCIHGCVHFGGYDQNYRSRVHHQQFHLPKRPLELARFRCHILGVSSTLYRSTQKLLLTSFSKYS